jgi:hypothetical protein
LLEKGIKVEQLFNALAGVSRSLLLAEENYRNK